MTYKQIEASRELRLWLGQIIIPTLTCVGGIMMIPEVREAVKAKAEDIKYNINNKKVKFKVVK